MMAVIVIFIYIKSLFFLNVYIRNYQKINHVYVRIFKKPKYWELSWAINMKFCIFEKGQ